MSDFIHELEIKEAMEKLARHGFGQTADAFLLNQTQCYTKKGRLNKSGACRALDCKPKQLDDQMEEMRALLENDF